MTELSWRDLPLTGNMSILRNLREGYVLMLKPEKLEKSLGMDILW